MQQIRSSFLKCAPFACAAALAVAVSAQQAPPHAPETADRPPVILYNTNAKAIAYQVRRLTNSELARVERNDADPKYRPIYAEMLIRTGVGREYFDEALAALAKFDRKTQLGVLFDALGSLAAGEEETADRLARVVFAQPVEALKKERALLDEAAKNTASAASRRAAYGAMMLADGTPKRAWEQASQAGHVADLLHTVPLLPSSGSGPAVRSALADSIAGLLSAGTVDPATRLAALPALAASRPDAAAFRLLAREVVEGTDPAQRAAAIRALQRIPASERPAGEIEPLVRALIATIGKAAPGQRTQPDMVYATQLAESLADALPAGTGPALRRDLRSLGVRVIRIQTIPEQMAFDLKWFVVQAARPVQIVLTNPDTMPHNLLIGRPGSLKEIGTMANAMSPPTDPAAKAYVPETPLVLQATRLLNWGETERLSFVAPKEPGEYPFVCTFPGHWVRMYGVMLVVESLDAWDAKRTVPTDPMTNAPFTVQREGEAPGGKEPPKQ